MLAFASCLLFTVTAAGGDFRAGTGMRVITPDPLLPVSGGFGPTYPVRDKRGELTVRAVVFARDETRVAVVGADLLGFPSVLCARAHALVPRIPARNILIGSTHTHSGPDCYAFPDGRGGHTGDLDYMDFVARQIAAAINEALDGLKPARIRMATGEAQGKIAYNYYAPDLYDRRLSVIQARTPGGDAIVTLLNYAVHPEVLGPRAGILSPDLVGPLYERIEARAGGMAIFMNGALGGMVTADNRDLARPADPRRAVWEDANTWEECVRIGHTLADEALRILGDAPVGEDPRLVCLAEDVAFPVDSEPLWQVVLHSPLAYPRGENRRVTTRINLLDLGDARILTIPGEALPNIGFYLKRKMGGEHNLLFGLTNDAFGYLLTKVDFDSFQRYDYVSRTSLGEMTGEIYIEAALRLLAGACPAPPPISKEIVFPIVAGIDFAEGPTFDPKGNLYFTRYIRNGTVGRRAPDGTVTVWAETGGQPNGLKVDFQGNVLVADQIGKKILRVPPAGNPVEVLTERCEGKPYLGPNDICLDTSGNIYFTDPQGSWKDNPIGSVYRIDPKGKVARIASGFAYPNGLAVSLDRKRFYLAESGENRLHVFDIGPDGMLANRKVLHQFPDSTVDGLALDESGRIWVARWEHGTVDVVTPEGDLVASIPAGGKQVTNVCFWGRSIYVSVAGQHSVHRLDVGVRGAEIVPGTVGPRD